MRLHKEKVMSVNGILCNVIMDKGPGRDSLDIIPFVSRKIWELGLGNLEPIWKSARELMDAPYCAERKLDNGIVIYNSYLCAKEAA